MALWLVAYLMVERERLDPGDTWRQRKRRLILQGQQLALPALARGRAAAQLLLPSRRGVLAAGLLLESLEHEVDEHAESAWQEEIARRLAELDAGRVELVPWDEVKAKLMRHTGAPRPD
jgi:putative addiction module component (TIGR02574 family)